MPCPIYESLLKEWKAAVFEDTRALDGGGLGQTMSGAKRLKWRSDARRALERAEDRLNAHIEGCAACRTDDREKYNLSQAHE